MIDKHLRPFSLRSQLVTLIILVLSGALIFQMWYNFWFFTVRMREAEQGALERVEQNNDMLTAFASDLTNASESLAKNSSLQDFLLNQSEGNPSTAQERIRALTFLRLTAVGLVESNRSVMGVGVTSPNREMWLSANRFNYSMIAGILREYPPDVYPGAFFATWISAEYNTVYSARMVAYIQPIHNILSFRERERLLGYAIIWGSGQRLDAIAASAAAVDGSHAVVLDERGQIVSASFPRTDTVMAESIAELLNRMPDDSAYDSADTGRYNEYDFNANGQNVRCAVYLRRNAYTGWSTLHIVPVSGIYAASRLALFQGLAITLAGGLAALLIGLIIAGRIEKPVARMTENLKSIRSASGRLAAEPPKLREAREFAMIRGSVNDMLQRVDETNASLSAAQERLFQTQLLQKQSEIQALQSQINPHFLYNTLECIRAIAAVYDVPEIVALTRGMGGIFRYSIQGGIRTTVREELACVTDYCVVMSIRRPDQIELITQVDEGILDCGTVRMSLQPLVENAISHGYSAGRKLTVRLIGRRVGDAMVFAVRDDGVGMDAQRLAAVRIRLGETGGLANSVANDCDSDGLCIGLTNIHARIRLLYGAGYGLSVHSRPGRGTAVLVRIPLGSGDVILNNDRIS
ncbi:hypothetical protein AGMMS49992_09740 [Clostridia bacterium]|nr:hypothetical protein AGMMS49992_09740 [Clostridia bacterium]